VRTDLKGQGLGRALLSRILDFARAEGIGRVDGLVLAENDTMLSICRQFGFDVRYVADDPGLVRVSLPLQ
jgi:acetyltransferase